MLKVKRHDYNKTQFFLHIKLKDMFFSCRIKIKLVQNIYIREK
jgi:hypothetical protein